VRTSVPISLKIPLAISSATETVTVTSNAADVLENVSSAHTMSISLDHQTAGKITGLGLE